jgi:hypothetical protein
MPNKMKTDGAAKELFIVRIVVSGKKSEKPETIPRKPRAKKPDDGIEKHLRNIADFLACIGEQGIAFRVTLE